MVLQGLALPQLGMPLLIERARKRANEGDCIAEVVRSGSEWEWEEFLIAVFCGTRCRNSFLIRLSLHVTPGRAGTGVYFKPAEALDSLSKSLIITTSPGLGSVSPPRCGGDW